MALVMPEETALEAIDRAIVRVASSLDPLAVTAPILTARLGELVHSRGVLLAQPVPEKKPAGFAQ